MRKVWLFSLAAALAAGAVGWCALSGSAAAASDPPPGATGEVWAVIDAKCLRCHNPKEKKGKLDMSSRAALLQGGDSGPALVVGDAAKSLMIDLVDFDEMPPRKEKPRVTKAELEKLRAWINAGAADRPPAAGGE